MHWNKITGRGAVHLAEALKNTVTLKKLDLAWNSMGSGLEGKIGNILGEALTLDCLIHLDISYNKFSKRDCLDLGEKLKENQTLYGFHMTGNGDCYVDSQGFVKEINQPTDVIDAYIDQLKRPKEQILVDGASPPRPLARNITNKKELAKLIPI